MTETGARLHWRRFVLLGAVTGAALMYLLDPQEGRRRRALARDKAGHYARRAGVIARRMSRNLEGRLRGLLHALEKRLPWYEPEPVPEDDQFIKDRVQSELGRYRDLPLHAVNFDCTDGIVRIRGTVPDMDSARRLVERTAAVEGVRAAVSLMRLPDGTPVGGIAGNVDAVLGQPRAKFYGEDIERKMKERWPALTDADILASEGHIDRMVHIIHAKTHQPEEEIRAALDSILIAAANSYTFV
ncbi:MAG: hypothetical protein C4290_09955 [Chloroflexota bacterium]